MIKKKKFNFLALAREAARIADDKKGKNIVMLNVRRLTAIADYFLIVTAESAPQINAINNTIVKTFREERGLSPVHREGIESTSWSVIDYGGLVIHIMSPSTREMYSLERIWADARQVK
ncbi:MAG: ribosome silencing factor [Endomicrobiales bacterium]